MPGRKHRSLSDRSRFCHPRVGFRMRPTRRGFIERVRHPEKAPARGMVPAEGAFSGRRSADAAPPAHSSPGPRSLHERRPEPARNLRRRRRRRLLHQPRHVGDAFRRRARSAAGHARRARAVRGCGHRGRGRLRAHGRQARLHAAASRSRARQRPGQPPQRPPGAVADRQRGGRARHLPPRAGRAAGLGHRRVREPGLGLDPGLRAGCQRGPGRGRRGTGRPDPAGPDRHADPAGGHGLDRVARQRGAAAGAGPGGPRSRRDRRRRRRPAARWIRPPWSWRTGSP